MHKMADDIIGLRSQVSRLESENSQLRHDLSLHQDLGHTLLDDTDADVMTKTEIADRIGIIPPTIISFRHIKISQGTVLYVYTLHQLTLADYQLQLMLPFLQPFQ